MAEDDAERVPVAQRSYPRWATTLAGLLPTALAVWALFYEISFAWQYIVNAPCSDGWSYVSLHEKRIAGTLAFITKDTGVQPSRRSV